MAVCTSGIAAIFLAGGRTIHSALKLSLNQTHEGNPVRNISKNSNWALILQQCKLNYWSLTSAAYYTYKRTIEVFNL